VQVEEFAPRMRPTAKFDTWRCCSGEQWFVAAIVIDQQMTLPVLQEVLRMPATSTGLIVD
jgi:hypothetical protein